MRVLSNWRSVRLWETELEERLHRRHALWLHGWCIGAVVLLAMWGAAHLQMLAGSQSLALRYLVTLGFGYVVYLLVLRAWASTLARQRDRDEPLDIDYPDVGGGDGSARVPTVQSGRGGDFGGGGASGDFSGAAEPAAAGEASGMSELAGGTLEVAGAAGEGAFIVVPVVAVFVAGCAVLLGAGSLLLLYFGSEALLAVAIELAFTYVSATAATRVAREGWLVAAVRLTWKPLAGALLCAVMLGAAIDVFAPQARSLPQAMGLVRAAR